MCFTLIVVGRQIFDFGNKIVLVEKTNLGFGKHIINVCIDCHLGQLTKRLTFCHASPYHPILSYSPLTFRPTSHLPPQSPLLTHICTLTWVYAPPFFCCNRKQINKAINFYLYFHTHTCAEFPKSANQIFCWSCQQNFHRNELGFLLELGVIARARVCVTI